MTRTRWLAILTVVVAAWSASAHAIRTEGASIHNDRLWRLAAQEQATLRQSGNLLADASLTGYLRKLTTRLWEQADSELNAPVVEVIMDTRMEACAYPNGYIVLTTGLLDPIDNEDQLAMILAHEMVHYARQHTAALYDHFLHVGTEGSDPRQAPGIVDVAQQVDASEAQADSEGLIILRRAGYCEREVLSLMANLMQHFGADGEPEALRRLALRRTVMERLIGRNPEQASCTPAAGGNLGFLLSCSAPVSLANAQSALRSGDWNQADKSVSKFLAVNPGDARAYYIQGEIARRRDTGQDNGHCIGFYEAALKIDPEQPLAHRALGEVYFKAGRYQLAKPHFEAFLNLAPQDDAREFIKGYLLRCQK